MAQLLAQEEKEKTTALKGKASSYENTMNTLQLAISLYVNSIPSMIIYVYLFYRSIVQDRFRRADEKR